MKRRREFSTQVVVGGGGLSPLKLCACIGSACCQILLCHDKIVFKLD